MKKIEITAVAAIVVGRGDVGLVGEQSLVSRRRKLLALGVVSLGSTRHLSPLKRTLRISRKVCGDGGCFKEGCW